MELNQRVPFIPKISEADSQNADNCAALKYSANKQSANFKGPLKLTIATICFILLVPGLYFVISYLFCFGNVKLDVDVLEVKKCPACAGQSICSYFYRGEIQLVTGHIGTFQTASDYRLSFPIVGLKAVMGLYETSKYVLLRRLASPATSYAVDKAVCRRGLRQGSDFVSQDILSSLTCIPHLSIWRWRPTNADTHDPHGNSIELPLSREVLLSPIHSSNQNGNEITTGFGPATRCSSDRLFEHLQHRFLERTSYGAETRWLRFDELMFLFNLAIDPQSIIIQSFPRKENWPFPNYLGSCGRWSVEEYHGVSLNHFCLASAWIRLQILLNILSLPESLEHQSLVNETYFTHTTISNDEQYSSNGYTIYLGDFDLNSLLLVDPMTYDVTLSNLRHAIVVDTQTLSELQFEPSAEEYSVPSHALDRVLTGLRQHDCLGNVSVSGNAGSSSTPPCLHHTHADDLCSHRKSDHNIWLICTSLLYGGKGYTTGCTNFLYQLPVELYTLIERCVHESGVGVRRRLIDEARRLIKQNL
ncbi:unnamed protein product [Heterobilharzia americana]|nr:unnamed protein product [Heterobilharzia americana]